MRTQLDHRVKGKSRQNETGWYLVSESDGTLFIESEFRNTNLKTGITHEGTEQYSLEEGRARMPSAALIKLEKFLATS